MNSETKECFKREVYTLNEHEIKEKVYSLCKEDSYISESESEETGISDEMSDDEYQKIKKNIKAFIAKILIHAGICLASFIIVFSITVSVGLTVRRAIATKTLRSDATEILESIKNSQEWSIENNLTILDNLRPDNWKQLSPQDKIDTISVVKNIELNYLGIPSFENIKFEVDNLGINIAGVYEHSIGTITIDYNHLTNDSAEDVLDTICHEARHCYQYTCIDLFFTTNIKYRNLEVFGKIKHIINNANNYIESSDPNDESFYEYNNQYMETDARRYAENEIAFYYDLLALCDG